VSVLVDKGWKLVDAGKYSDAAASFEKALAQNASHPDATLGFGYASLKLGRKDDAAKYLCRARDMGGSSGTEAKGMIESNDLSCP
jgi:Tfp pilus assembly protein PilF